MSRQLRPKYYQTHEFKALNAKWSEKLKKSGFKDIECGETGFFTPYGSEQFAKNIEYNKSKEEYYRLAGQFLHEHQFKNELEKRIWELHSEGMSIRKIVKKLFRKKYFQRIEDVQKITARLAKEMINNARY